MGSITHNKFLITSEIRSIILRQIKECSEPELNVAKPEARKQNYDWIKC
jgi:hypothetical protein